jgi:predicted nucleic acid-binding protein
MTPFVFDTGALSLFYANDQRLKPYVDKVSRDTILVLLSSVTLAEFYYKTCQSLGREVATLWSTQLSERMRVVETNPELSLAAGVHKCKNNRLSLADSFALALTDRVNGTLLTTDRELARNKESRVRFFEV